MPGLTEESNCLDTVVDGEDASDFERNGVIFNITPIDGARCSVIVEDIGGLPQEEFVIPMGEAFDTIIGEPKTYIEERLQNALYRLHVGDSGDISTDLDKHHKPDTDNEMKNKQRDDDDVLNTSVNNKSQSDNKLPVKETVDISHCQRKLQVKLLGFQNPPNVCDYTRLQKFEIAKFHKQAGVDLFKSMKIKFAYKRFSKSLKFLLLMLPKKEIMSKMQEEYDQLRSQCYSNMAACLLVEGEYEAAVKNCTQSLDIDKTYVKPLYRRAEAYFNLLRFEECKHDIDSGLTLEPNNKAFHKLLKTLKNKL